MIPDQPSSSVTAARAPRFAPASPFTREVTAAVDGYFRARDLSPHADAAMRRKTALVLAWAAASYALVVAPGVPIAFRLLGSIALGFGYAGIGMSIGHDAIHGAYSSRPWVNRLLGCGFDLIGASSYAWRYTHNIAHHTYPNIDDLDPDVDFDPVIRAVATRKWRPFQRAQWLYAYPIYALTGIRWVFYKDIADLLRRRMGPYSDLRHPWWAWALLLAGRTVALGLVLVIPLLVVDAPRWQILLGAVLTWMTAGATMASVFVLAHIVEGPAFSPPITGQIDDAFFDHQLRTTADFACDNRFLAFYLGGLNFQVEHHLFPKVCSIHYPALRPIVREIAARHGLPNHEFPTLAAALAAHVSLLRRMGRKPAELDAGSA